MSFDPAAALVAYHKALDGRDEAALRTIFAVDARYRSPGVGEVAGRENLITAMRAYFAALPDQQAWDDQVSRVSDHVAQCHWHLRATNKTTGAVVERHGLETVTFNAAGEVLLVDVVDWD